MFYVISRAQQEVHAVDQRLVNPKNPSNPLTLLTFRAHTAFPVIRVNSKRAQAEYYDSVKPAHQSPEAAAMEQIRVGNHSGSDH